MSLLAISDTHKREKANLLATKSPTFGSHSSVNGHVPHAQIIHVSNIFILAVHAYMHTYMLHLYSE